MTSKRSTEVSKIALEMLLRLRADGYHINRVHTDQGHEFAGQFLKWAHQRGLHVTRTPGDDPPGNGRAELAVKFFKTQIRKCLLEAQLGADHWPLALRHINEVSRCSRLGKTPTWPQFWKEVVIRKRRWKRGGFEPTMEVVRYVSPAPEEHGHWVQPEGEVPRLTRCYVQKAERVPNEGTWIALEKETVDELSKRRRIREKSSIRLLKSEEMSSSQDPEELKAEASRREVKEMMEESVGHMFEAEAEVAAHEVEVLRSLKKMTEEAEEPEDEVLQTKVVSPKEVSKAWNHWLPAIEEEVNSLIVEKEALQQIGKKEVEEIVRKAERAGKKVEFLPSKMVYTRKPGPLGGRMKARWVVCGNFEEKRSNEDTYSSGAGASAFRLLAATAAHFQWQGGTVDIKTAFLNAEMEAAEGESIIIIIIIKPPMVMLEKNFLPPAKHLLHPAEGRPWISKITEVVGQLP